MSGRSPPADLDRAAAPGPTAPPSLVTAAIIVVALYLGRDILVPFTLAALLTFLLAPVVRGLHRAGLGRVPAISLTVLAAALVIVAFAGVLVGEATSVGEQVPQYRENIEQKLHSLTFPGVAQAKRLAAALHDMRDELVQLPSRVPAASGGGAPAAKPVPVEIWGSGPISLELVRTVLWPLLQPLATAGLVLVFVILMMLEREDLRDRLLRLAGGRDLQRTTAAMDDAAYRISRYLLAQSIVNASCGLAVGFGLAVIGVPNPALWGVLVAALRFLPYIGIFIAAAFPLALAIAVDPGWSLLLWTIALMVTVELCVAYIIEPLVYGARSGLSSVAVIASAVFWTWLWGPIGLLLSTPLTVCLVAIGRHLPQLHFFAVMLGNEPALTAVETFYQRLLADDPEDATEQAEEFAEEHSLVEFFDSVVAPALLRAQHDSDREALSPGRRALIRDGIATMLENLGETGRSASAAAAGAGAVVCVAGRNELDEAAGLVLAYLLRPDRPAAVLPAEGFSQDGVHRVLFEAPAMVCLSLVSTRSPARARYLVRRLRRMAPRAAVLVGFWGNGLSAADAVAATGADAVVTSFDGALAEICACGAKPPLEAAH